MTTLYIGSTGYDDSTVTFLISYYHGSYLLTSFLLSTDDYMPSYLTDTGNVAIINTIKNTTYNTSGIYENVSYLTYTYNSPSKNGRWYLPPDIANPPTYEYLWNAQNNPDGIFKAKTQLNVKNLYNCFTIKGSAFADIGVLERWPEPRFFFRSIDLPQIRKTTFCNSEWDYPNRYNKSNTVTRESNRFDEALRYDINYGTDPMSSVMLDRSIARTWPISSWFITLSTNNFRNTNIFPVTTLKVNANSNIFVEQDEQNLFDTLSSFIWRYGDYSVTLNVQASTTSTSSDKHFVNYIKIKEFEPFANFWAISAKTLPSNFKADNNNILPQLINVQNIPNGVYNDGTGLYQFVSGYAPNLTIWFKDSSEPHTFPISSYHWDFGDPYNEGPKNITSISSNYYTISNVTINSGSFLNPCWRTNVMGHTAVHTYIMPGTYDVTLTVRASNTSTQDICARYVGANSEKKFYVYVEEILPECGPLYASLNPYTGYTTAVSTISGITPITGYFMASGIKAGSFPICRIDWDFGDGNIQRVTRFPFTTATNQGLPLVYLATYSYDSADPRNFAVPHVYNNTTVTNQYYNINLSAYACNTNTMISCTGTKLLGPIIPQIEKEIDETKKLIGSRIDDYGNLIYIFEGQNELTTHTIILTGEVK